MLQTAIHNLHPVPSPRAPMVTIRCAKPRDLAELREMIVDLSAHHGDAAPITNEQLERDLFGRTPWITALVAEAGGQLIGYAILVPQYRGAEGARGMELHHLFVRPGHRGTGIGRHLVARAREQAKMAGCDYLTVSAATGNLKAHRFYESERFVPRPVTGMRYMQKLG